MRLFVLLLVVFCVGLAEAESLAKSIKDSAICVNQLGLPDETSHHLFVKFTKICFMDRTFLKANKRLCSYATIRVSDPLFDFSSMDTSTSDPSSPDPSSSDPSSSDSASPNSTSHDFSSTNFFQKARFTKTPHFFANSKPADDAKPIYVHVYDMTADMKFYQVLRCFYPNSPPFYATTIGVDGYEYYRGALHTVDKVPNGQTLFGDRKVFSAQVALDSAKRLEYFIELTNENGGWFEIEEALEKRLLPNIKFKLLGFNPNLWVDLTTAALYGRTMPNRIQESIAHFSNASIGEAAKKLVAIYLS